MDEQYLPVNHVGDVIPVLDGLEGMRLSVPRLFENNRRHGGLCKQIACIKAIFHKILDAVFQKDGQFLLMVSCGLDSNDAFIHPSKLSADPPENGFFVRSGSDKQQGATS